MSRLDNVLADAVAAGDAPFLVAMTGNAEGVTWQGGAGERRPGEPAQIDTVFRIFSMTKAVGCTAAMILIDRGQLSADTPVEQILPEFKDIRVLEGFEGDKPHLRAPKKKATIRHLATHTSGFVYEFWNPDIPKYMEATGLPTIISGRLSALYYPLVFDPGERWDYGIGIDWLGRAVEKVDGRSIDAFCREEIFDPLGMNDTRFEVEPHMASRLAKVTARREDGQIRDFELSPPSRPEFYGMGHALYSTAPDYMRFVRMHLNRGALEGKRIISAANHEQLLANQIGGLKIERMVSVAPVVSADVDIFPHHRKSHSFTFMRMEEDVASMRSAGSQFWAGVLNTHFWFDPAKDMAGIIMTQMLPFADPRFMKVYEAFEHAAYAA